MISSFWVAYHFTAILGHVKLATLLANSSDIQIHVLTKLSKGKRSDTQINKSNFDKESTSKVAFNYMAIVVVPLLHF